MIKEAYQDAERHMKSTIQTLEEDLAGVRTGRASPALVNKLLVEYYGSSSPLMQLATISVPEPRQLLIRPFDASSLQNIERAIMTSDLGLTPMNDGKVIRLNIPPLNEERRHELTKIVNHRLEEARISVRNIRRDSIKDLREFENEKIISKDDLKRGEDQIQKLTDKIVEEISTIGERKEKEIMEI
ncbi:MAG TPA: ribosome recycling factor [Anaerolineae bacterium]|nr:ribosome recycling factor [Anaerolineae bacterium]